MTHQRITRTITARRIASDLLKVGDAIGADVFILRAAAFNIRKFGDVPIGSVIRPRLAAVARRHRLKGIRDLARDALELTGIMRP